LKRGVNTKKKEKKKERSKAANHLQEGRWGRAKVRKNVLIFKRKELTTGKEKKKIHLVLLHKPAKVGSTIPVSLFLPLNAGESGGKKTKEKKGCGSTETMSLTPTPVNDIHPSYVGCDRGEKKKNKEEGGRGDVRYASGVN